MGISPPTPVILHPYATRTAFFPAPKDDWGYYEGLPTPALSPLMPFNTVPWFSRKWQYDKLQSPIYSTGSVVPINSSFNSYFRAKTISATAINQPSLLKDFHLIAIRRQIEQLFSPFFSAELVVRVQDTMDHPPLFYITHNRFQQSWWATGSDGDGTFNVFPGHHHCMRFSTPTGSLICRAQLTIGDATDAPTEDGGVYYRRGGTIWGLRPGQNYRASYGNYYILDVRYGWYVTEFWRKIAVEEWADVQADYSSVAPNFLMINWGTWNDIFAIGISPTGRAKFYAIDCGQMWQERNYQGQPAIYKTGEGQYQPRMVLINSKPTYVGPGYSSCTRPIMEGPLIRGMSGGSDAIAYYTPKPDSVEWASVAGFHCGIYEEGAIPNVQTEPTPQPDFPETIISNNHVIYDYAITSSPAPTGNGYWEISYTLRSEPGVYDFKEIRITPNEQTKQMVGFKWVVHCIGCAITPFAEVDIMDLNGRRYTVPVNQVELYFD